MEPVIVPRSEHPISRKSIDPDAVKVLYRLHRAGFQGYLVGGGVRDLMLGRNPKDFDISTDAHPQQVKRLFRNCRLIGRRFRLAHVHFGGKIVEVSTFRKRSEPVPDDALPEGEEEDILIRSDNTFGTAEEDALRRDFTINGLFYDIGSFAVIDYVAGLDDLKTRTIRTIGDPDIRFREDPVRMIRAIKFAARLDFDIEPATWQAILDNHDEILKSAPPRVLEEFYRLLGGGAAARSFHLLEESGMLDILVPQLTEYLATPEEEPAAGEGVEPPLAPMHRWLTVLDRLRHEDAPLTNALLIGALVGPMAFDDTLASRGPVRGDGIGEPGADGADEGEDDADFYLSPDTEDRIRDVLATIGVPRRDTERLFQTFKAMRRFSGQRSRRFSPRSFVTKNYFPEAFLFLHLAIEATGRSEDVLIRWRKLAEEAGLDGSIPTGSRRRRRRRRRRGDDGPAGFDAPASGDEFDDTVLDDDGVEAEPAVNGTGDEPAPRAAAAPVMRQSRSRREAAPEPVPVPVPDAAPAPRPAPRQDDEEDEDSQIRFLGWSDQPEILRDRPEPPPLVNPYTRQAPGAPRRGGFRRPEGGPRHGGGGHGGSGGPRSGSGPRSGGYQGGGPRSGGSGPRNQGPGQGGGTSGGRYGGPGRPEGGGDNRGGRGNWGSGRSYGGGQGGGYGRGPGGPESGRGGPDQGPRQGGGQGQGPASGPPGRRPRRRNRRRQD